ncbi:hypothetical protein GGI24_003982, partial [Coemansia furcata]
MILRREDPHGAYRGQYDLSHVKAMFVAGERCPPEIHRWWVRHITGVDDTGKALHPIQTPVTNVVSDNWWQTETGSPLAGLEIGLSDDGALLPPVKYGSAGMPVQGVDLRILRIRDELDEEGGVDLSPEEVGRGVVGNVVVKLPLPPGIMTTLWGDDERFFDAYFRRFPGYYDTGDTGVIDTDGYVHVLSRADDVINVAAHRISTSAIEEVVVEHREIAECCVVARAHPIKGSVPVVVAVYKHQRRECSEEQVKDDVVAAIRNRVGAFTSLYHENIVFVERLPKTRSGKVLRKMIRSMISALLLEGRAPKLANIPTPATIEDDSVKGEIWAALAPVVSAVLNKLGTLKDDEGEEEGGDEAQNEVHRLNKQIGQVKSALESANSSTRAAQTELQETKARLDAAAAEQQQQQALSSAQSAAEAQLHTQIGQLREEKRALLEQLGERRDQLDARATESKRAQEALAEVRQQRAREQEELTRLRAQTSVSDVSEHMLRQSLELAKNQVAWLDEELGRTQAELQQAKGELARASTTGRAEAARLRADAESQAEVVAELQARAAGLDRSLRAKLEAERVGREERAEQAEQFRREMAAQKKLCEEWEKTTAAAKAHVRSVEDALSEVEEQQRMAEAHAAEAAAAHEQRLEEAQRQVAQATQRAADVEAQLRTANQLLSESAGRGQQALLLSPTASAAARLQGGGGQGRLNITQLYSEKAALEDQLRSADAEIACLRESMEQILAELEDRAPIIAAEREEHQRLLSDADRIAQDLAAVRQEHALAGQALREAQRDRDLARRQLGAEQQQAKDLARQ